MQAGQTVCSIMSYYLFILGALIAALILAWYRFCYAPYQLFKRIGIPHPPVTPFFGNTLEMTGKEGFLNTLDNWITKHGKIFGYYIGASPRLIIIDPDLLKEVMVKHFNSFTNRNKRGLFDQVRGNFPPGLFTNRDNDWKQTRGIASPSFSSKKLKIMAPHIERICDSLNERMEEISKGNESAEVWRLFGQFTMETILATAFGRQVNVLKGEANELTKAAAGFFTTFSISVFLWNTTFTSQFSFIATAMKYLYASSNVKACFNYLRDASLQIIKERRQVQADSSKYMDFLQLLMDARADDNDELPSSTKKTLTDEEIVSICVDFLLAGYETTSTCLAFTAYLLALNTDIQDKLCQIIEDYYHENEDATLYDASHDIQYLDWVISESMRMYPPAARTARYCSETCNINGVIIPEDMIVIVPIKSLHYSSEYWDEPDVFRPERFSPEEKEKRHPLCYMPFGWGPRNCIGMRFALMEAKMALLSMLRKYKFQVAPDTEIPLKTKLGVTYSPANGIYLKVITLN